MKYYELKGVMEYSIGVYLQGDVTDVTFFKF